MNFYLKIILIIFGFLYLISPVDMIPDLLLPFIGWLDDGVVIGTIYYLIRYGRLPFFLFRKKGPFKPSYNGKTQNFTSGRTKSQKTGQGAGTGSQKKESFKTIKTPHEILGLGPDASKDEIQSAYRQAIKKYHPDKVSHLGKEFSTLANEKFIEIQNAYDFLMKK